MRLWRCVAASSSLGLLLPLSRTAAQEDRAADVTAITSVEVIPMDRQRILSDHTVLIRRGIIAAVGPADELRIPDGARRIEGRGRYLMPGLADMHIHLGAQPFGTEPEDNVAMLLLYVANGVTTVLNLHGEPDHLELRKRVLAGEVMGPTIYTASPIVNDTALTREGGRRLVRDYRAAGYDYIKVYNQLTQEGYRGILVEAHRLGMPVIGHVVRSVNLEGTLGSGQRGIVHLEEYLYSFFNYQNSDTTLAPGHKLDYAAIPYLTDITRKAGVWVTPTLETFETIAAQVDNLDRVLARPEVAYVPPRLLRNWLPEQNTYRQRFTSRRHLENLQQALRYQRQLAAALQEAGVGILAGTDAPIPSVVPGFSLHGELENFVEIGLTPFQALVAATRNPAAYLGESEVFGTITVGKRADLLLLEANPLADVRNAARRIGVMVRGRWLPEPDLQRMLRRAKERYEREQG